MARPNEQPNPTAQTDGTGPYAGFEGRVGRTFAGSEGWWPPRATAPADAPNIIVMIVDDLGYSDIGCYGSEIDTPNLDAPVVEGSAVHQLPLDADVLADSRRPAHRASNAHAAGVGSVPHSDSGFPGYAMELAENAATVAETLRDNGWSTMAVGKWHLTKDAEQNAAGNKRSWPCQRGFERYYGVLDAFTNLHHPHRIVEDNHQVEVDQYPDDYFFTDDITDRAISMIRETKAADPSKPFFLYFAHAAVHAPLHAKAEDMAKYRGRYDAGWDAIRERTVRSPEGARCRRAGGRAGAAQC